jgi:hypothetical protein
MYNGLPGLGAPQGLFSAPSYASAGLGASSNLFNHAPAPPFGGHGGAFMQGGMPGSTPFGRPATPSPPFGRPANPSLPVSMFGLFGAPPEHTYKPVPHVSSEIDTMQGRIRFLEVCNESLTGRLREAEAGQRQLLGYATHTETALVELCARVAALETSLRAAPAKPGEQ